MLFRPSAEMGQNPHGRNGERPISSTPVKTTFSKKLFLNWPSPWGTPSPYGEGYHLGKGISTKGSIRGRDSPNGDDGCILLLSPLRLVRITLIEKSSIAIRRVYGQGFPKVANESFIPKR